jgi:pyruvate dehydrogenase E2 component (dihydrolipoamide acetyltransferase)
MKEVTMPKLSDTMTEGTVIVWRKAAGDRIERGEVIAEVETDKATMELEAFASGTLLEIRVDAGQNVPVGTVIGIIGQPEQSGARPAASPDKDTGTDADADTDTDAATRVPSPEPAVTPTERAAAQPAGQATDAPRQGAAVLAAPVVRHRAQELGIDLAKVSGSGPGGRILLEDLAPPPRQETAPDQPPAVAPPAASVTAETPSQPPQPRDNAELAAAVQPMSRMRAAIARTVSDSWRSIPHFSVTVEVRMDAAEQLRRQLKESGTPASLTALLLRATALALGSFPRLNASLREAGVVVHPEISIGIVTRRDDGLLVPVVRDCGELPLAELANRTTRLVERARHGQLSDTELTGATFAISNLGMYGIHSFVALILPPMAAVLAAGAVRDGIVAHDGRPEVARLLALTLSADHRLVDGVYAAEFLQAVKAALETPASLSG